MRRVSRTDVTAPGSLLTPGQAGAKELARAIDKYEPTRTGSITFRAYKGDDVRHALEALFHGKCAYCESRYNITGPVDVEHYRPKGKVDEDEAHPGYWWLAADWTNLLPSCLDCNRRRFQPTPKDFASLTGILDAQQRKGFSPLKTGKESCFPISATGVRMMSRPDTSLAASALAAEDALLLNPCTHVPEEHLRFHIDRESPLGLVYPAGSPPSVAPILPIATNKVQQIENAAKAAGISVAGAVSIQIYGLNRLALIQERTRLLRKLEFLASIVIELSAASDGLMALQLTNNDARIRDFAAGKTRATVHRALAEMRAMAEPDAPFSAMVKAWIEVFKADLAKLPTPGGGGAPVPVAAAARTHRAVNLEDDAPVA